MGPFDHAKPDGLRLLQKHLEKFKSVKQIPEPASATPEDLARKVNELTSLLAEITSGGTVRRK